MRKLYYYYHWFLPLVVRIPWVKNCYIGHMAAVNVTYCHRRSNVSRSVGQSVCLSISPLDMTVRAKQKGSWTDRLEGRVDSYGLESRSYLLVQLHIDATWRIHLNVQLLNINRETARTDATASSVTSIVVFSVKNPPPPYEAAMRSFVEILRPLCYYQSINQSFICSR